MNQKQFHNEKTKVDQQAGEFCSSDFNVLIQAVLLLAEVINDAAQMPLESAREGL